MASHRTQNRGQTAYYISLASFLASLGLLLFTVVDIRRGFLFPEYFKVGAPSTLLNLDLRHLPMLLVGGLGAWLGYRYMKRLERALKESRANLNSITRLAAIVIGVLLIIDLLTYRGVPASRIIAAGEMGTGPGTMGLGWAMPVASFPSPLQPLAEGVNYLLVVWHATALGMLLGGLFLVAGQILLPQLKGSGFSAHLAAVASALPQPFCSCCAAPIGSALYRKGASLGPVLAFTVSSPMLNITTLFLAAALLPAEFAILRVGGGIVVGVFVTYAVSRLTAGWITGEEPAAGGGSLLAWGSKAIRAYNRLFRFEKLFSEQAVDSPVTLIANWLGMAWRLARVIIPLFIVFSVIAVYIVRAMPDSGNNIIGVAVTAMFGTLLMVPTWTEIPLAVGLINGGLSGIAAVVLITLPAVSLPCLAVIAGAIRSLRVSLVLGLSVLISGILAGIIFL